MKRVNKVLALIFFLTLTSAIGHKRAKKEKGITPPEINIQEESTFKDLEKSLDNLVMKVKELNE